MATASPKRRGYTPPPAERRGPALNITNPDIRTKFLSAVRQFVPLRHAARMAGISESGLHLTLARGRDAQQRQDDGEELSKDDQACVDFLEATLHARSVAVTVGFGSMAKAAAGGYLLDRRTLPNGTVEEKWAPPDWRAADKVLQRSFPGEFTDALEVTGAGGGPIQVQQSAAMEALAAQLHATMHPEVLDGETLDLPELEA